MSNSVQYTTEQMLDGFSDAYKELHGVRPRHTPGREELIHFWDSLQSNLDYNAEQEAKDEAVGLARFEGDVTKTMELAGDRHTAIRWLMDAEGIDLTNGQDVEHFFWGYGLSMKDMDRLTKEFLGR